MKHSIENYDPRYMDEYLRQGRRERALAFGELMASLKQYFTKPSQSDRPTPLGRPSASTAC